MRILHLIQKPQLRGAEVFAANLCTHLRRQGEDVMLVSVFKGDSPLPFDGPSVHIGASFRYRFFDVRSWYRLSKIIKKFNPDIIQANSGFTLKFAVFSRWLFRWKHHIVFRNASTISLYIRTTFAKIFNSIFLNEVKMIASVSRTSSKDIITLYPFLADRTVHIPTGIEVFDLTTVDREDSFFTIIHVGGFTFEKDHQALLEIFSRVIKKIPQARLWLVGDGPLKEDIKQRAENMGLINRITFYGYVKQVAKLLRSSDLFVCTSKIEGLPAAILEAFYCRVPVISYDAGGIGEIVTDGVTGRLINKGDIGAFTEAVVSFYQSNEGELYVENAFQRVNSAYMNDVVAREFRNLYTNIIHQPSAASWAIQNKS